MSSITYVDKEGDWAWNMSVVAYNRYYRLNHHRKIHIISRHNTEWSAYRKTRPLITRLGRSGRRLNEVREEE